MKEALKLALEALEGLYLSSFTMPDSPISIAITAIKAALAQECPNLKNCKGACFQCEYFNVDTGMMEYPAAQPAQEPVAWLTKNKFSGEVDLDAKNAKETTGWSAAFPVYTTPQQRPWVNLTDREKSNLWLESRAAIPRFHTYASLVEAKLKEKNT
jgi:hypothetical protein